MKQVNSNTKNNCPYCGTKCFEGEGCDEWQADGFNKENKTTETPDYILWWEKLPSGGERQKLVNKHFPLSLHFASDIAPELIEQMYLAEHIPLTTEKELTNLSVGHTVGNWVVRDFEICGPFGSHKSICEMTGNFMDEAEKQANAHRIVQAVNNHDALVSALKDATERMERARGILKRDGNSNWGMLDTTELKELLNSINQK